ncbi:MAG: tRNA (adenosine(37)-N6)-threonylcarbamoyltransferase complex dimerization subunit type 1 TsaB [Elusimicrobiota bacterium]
MAEKLTAGICTSGSRVKLSLLAEGKFHNASKKALNQERVLFSMMDRLLGGRKARLTDISTLCVITGPGRFTGLRVGLTLASALKTLAGIRVYSSTLFDILAAQAAASKEFMAWAAGKKEVRIVALVHAFKDEYFCQAFRAARQQDSAAAGQRGSGTARQQDRGAATLYALRFTLYDLTPAEAPRWFKDTEVAGYLAAQGSDLYIIADAEEKTDIYSLAPEALEKAPARVSKILPEFVIKTGLALKNRDLTPLYLKPAKYELENKSRPARFWKEKKRSCLK